MSSLSSVKFNNHAAQHHAYNGFGTGFTAMLTTAGTILMLGRPSTEGYEGMKEFCENKQIDISPLAALTGTCIGLSKIPMEFHKGYPFVNRRSPLLNIFRASLKTSLLWGTALGTIASILPFENPYFKGDSYSK